MRDRAVGGSIAAPNGAIGRSVEGAHDKFDPLGQFNS
jgi:hypothetical protein